MAVVLGGLKMTTKLEVLCERLETGSESCLVMLVGACSFVGLVETEKKRL